MAEGEILPEGTTQDLIDKGFLDQRYMELLSQHKAEEEQVKNAAAQGFAKEIQTDPNIADIAQRTKAIVEGSQGQQPTGGTDPTAGTSQPMPMQAPGAESAAAALPTSTAIPTNATAIPTPITPQGVPTAPMPTPGPSPDNSEEVTAAVETPLQAGQENAAAQKEIHSVLKDTVSAQQASANTGNVNGVYGVVQPMLDRLGEIEKQYGNLNDKQAGAYEAAAGIATKTANQMAASAAKNQADMNQTLAAEAAQSKKYEDFLNQSNSLQIDPNHFWANRTTGQKVMIGIGLMLSGIGGSTKAIDVVNDAIRTDIDAQKANAELRMKGLEGRKTLFEMAHQLTGDKFQATQLAQSAALQQAQIQLEAMTKSAQSDEARANGLKGIADLEKMRMETMAPLLKNSNLLVASQLGQGGMPGQPSAAGGTPLSGNGVQQLSPTLSRVSNLPSLPANFSPLSLPEEANGRYVNGVGLAQTPESRKEIANEDVRWRAITTGIAQLESLRGRVGNSINPGSPERVQAQKIGQNIASNIEQIQSERPLSPTTKSILDGGILNDPLGPNVGSFVGSVPILGPALSWANKNVNGDPMLAYLKQLKADTNEDYANKLGVNMQVLDPKLKNFLISNDVISQFKNVGHGK